MIRLSLLLLLISIVIGVLLYFRFPSYSILRVRQFVGIQSCRGCHGTSASGDQYGVWATSAHARAFNDLLGAEARTYGAQHGIASPEKDSNCLLCHTTAFANQPGERGMTFQITDGVTCESCHGPSSDYSTYSIMRDKKLYRLLGGLRGTKDQCRDCHALTMSDRHCPFQREPFDLVKGWSKIAHAAPSKSASR